MALFVNPDIVADTPHRPLLQTPKLGMYYSSDLSFFKIMPLEEQHHDGQHLLTNCFLSKSNGIYDSILYQVSQKYQWKWNEQFFEIVET